MLPIPAFWHAVAPEVHSTMLNVGGTPAGIVLSGTSWATLAAQYAAAIVELEGILSSVQAAYQGPSAEQFVASHQPMVTWLSAVVAKASAAATSHAGVAQGYGTAVLMMPTMPELINNHVVHGALVSTNFFGVNTIPIGFNEADYVRMWNQAGDVMATWDAVSTATADTIVETPPSPITLIPGVGESGNAAATAASFLTQGQAAAGGAALSGASMMGNTMLAKKAASSPASIGNKVPAPQTSQGAAQQQDKAQLGQNASSFMQQASSLASSAPSAIQGPAQMLTQAPQMLAQAPQQLGSMLSQFGSGGSSFGQPGGGMPVGFPGTGAIGAMKPAGLTSLAGGALGSGPSRPLMPSTWGSAPTSAAEAASSARGTSPMATGLPGASASGGGAGAGGMMGAGGRNRQNSSSEKIDTYSDAVNPDADVDDDDDGGTFAMAR